MVSPTDHTTYKSSSEEKLISKTIINRYQQLNVSSLQTNTNMIDEKSTDSIWTSSDDSTSKSLPVVDFYPDSYSSSSSISSYRPELKTFSSSSGYNSSLNSISDYHCVHLHLDDQNSSSSSSSSSSSYCRKCIENNQLLSSDTDDDSQSTIISTNFSSIQKRPRSLPIAIQQSKTLLNEDETDNDSSFYQCMNEIQLHINRQKKNSLQHFIMSPTDKVKIQMKYQENNMKNNELKISQLEDIDFKRSKLKAIRVLYQNRIHLNSIQSLTGQQSTILSSRTTSCNQRLLRSLTSCSVFDEHEIVSSSTTRTNINVTHEKSSRMEIFNCLRINFIESLLHGKIYPCGILDGFTVKLSANGLFLSKQVILPVTTFWFNVSEHQAASPYLGFINLQCLPKRGYHIPIKGTITLALLNPNGTVIHLFFILYDCSDMPIDHRTFIRQRIILMPENNNTGDKKENLRYLIHIRFITSQTGKLYIHSDIRLIFARNKLDYDERESNGRPQLITLTDIPTPKYWPRK